jgi:hypothetical protein
MTPPTRITGAVAVLGTAAALVFPAVAGAKPGDKTFAQTFPVASTVCAKVAAGTESKHLKKFVTQVTADCTALQTAFTAAQTTELASRATIEPPLTAARAAVKAACPTTTKPVAGACMLAHRSNDASIHSLAKALHIAQHSYFSTVEAARLTFWKEIKSLPGEKHIKADTPIPVPSA